ncbi:MAG: hypothetical protein WCG87_11590 [Bacteroidota bacterium]
MSGLSEKHTKNLIFKYKQGSFYILIHIKMKHILVVIFTLLAFSAKSQNGYINDRGFFSFSNSNAYLQYLDYCKKNSINGTTYFYFKIKISNSGTTKIVVCSTDDLIPNDVKCNNYSDLRNPINYTDKIKPLEQYFMDDSIFNSISKITSDSIFHKYISNSGALQNVSDPQLEKAIIYRLLKENILVCQDDIGGNIILSKVYHKFK